MRNVSLAVVATLSFVGSNDVNAGRGGVPGPNRPDWDAAGDRLPNACLSPSFTDLCQVFGVTESFAFRRSPILVGEHWRPFTAWYTNLPANDPERANLLDDPETEFDESLPLLYPAWYDCSSSANNCADPVADFLSKLDTVTVLVDPDLPARAEYVFDPANVTKVVRSIDVFGSDTDPALALTPLVGIMPVLPPQQPGMHTYVLRFRLNAPHCDGLAPLEWNCLPANRNLTFEFRRFEVSPRTP